MNILECCDTTMLDTGANGSPEIIEHHYKCDRCGQRLTRAIPSSGTLLERITIHPKETA